MSQIIPYLLLIHNRGTVAINSKSPKWYDYPSIVDDMADAVDDFPEHTQFEIHFQTDDVATFQLGDRQLIYANQNGSRNVFVLDNVYRRLRNGRFDWLEGEFLSLEPGDNFLYITGAYNVRVIFRPMYA